MRYQMQQAMEEAKSVILQVDEEYLKLFGRRYGLVEAYRCEDAEMVLVTSGTVSSTSREVIDQYRDEGKAIGMLKMRTFRPFPSEEIRRVLKGIPKVAVIDRNISFGMGGIFAEELRSALCNEEAAHGLQLHRWIGREGHHPGDHLRCHRIHLGTGSTRRGDFLAGSQKIIKIPISSPLLGGERGIRKFGEYSMGSQEMKMKRGIPEEEYIMSGHLACSGCGATIAMRYALKALGEEAIVVVPACCWTIIPGAFPIPP